VAKNSGVACIPKDAGPLRGQTSHSGLHDLWIREKNDRRGEPRYALGEKRRHQKVGVGAWCRIGGGQGALSQAHKETGVACIPSKQPDYNGLSERKQCRGSYHSLGFVRVKRTELEAAKAEQSQARPELAKERSAMNQLDGCGSLALVVGSQGILIRPTKATQVAENQG